MTKPESAKAQPIAPPVVYFTYDEERVEHIISDDKLMLISQGGKDSSLELCIGALGVAFGYLQNVVAVIGKILTSQPIEPWQGIGSAIFMIAAATCIVTALHHRGTSGGVDDILKQIKTRKVGIMGEFPYAGGKPFAGDPTVSTETSSTTD